MGNWFYFRLQEIPFHFTQTRNGGLTIIDTDFYTSLTRESIHVSHNSEARSRNHCCHGQAMSTTYAVCVCILASFNLHTMRTFTVQHHIFLCSLSGSNTLFQIISQKAPFSEKVIEDKMYVLISTITMSPIFLILRRIRRDSIINLHTYSCIVLVIIVIF